MLETFFRDHNARHRRRIFLVQPIETGKFGLLNLHTLPADRSFPRKTKITSGTVNLLSRTALPIANIASASILATSQDSYQRAHRQLFTKSLTLT